MAELKMQSNLFDEMLETVKGAIPTLVAIAPDNQFTPGIIIDVAKDGEYVMASAFSETLSIISSRYPIESGVEGTFEVPSSWIMNAKSKLPKDTITLKHKDEDVVLSSGRFRTTSESVQVQIFKSMDDPQKVKFPISPDTFMECLPTAIKTMGVNDFRPVLNGANFSWANDILKITSSNGHIASCYKEKMASSSMQEFSKTIPRKSIMDIFALVKKHQDKDIEMTVCTRQVIININGGPTITTPVVQGEYFDIDHLFKNNKITPRRVIFTANRNELIQTVQRVASLSKEGSNPAVVFKCEKDKNNMSISLPEDNHNGKRKAKDEITITRKDGYDEAFSAQFNGQYIANVLSGSKEDATFALAQTGTRKSSIIDLDNESNMVKCIAPINV